MGFSATASSWNFHGILVRLCGELKSSAVLVSDNLHLIMLSLSEKRSNFQKLQLSLPARGKGRS